MGDMSWLSDFTRALGSVPQSLQTMILIAVCFVAWRGSGLVPQWYKDRKEDPGAPADTTKGAVEQLEQKIMPELELLKTIVRDLKEETRREADIEIAIAGKLDKNAEALTEIKTNVGNLARR